jgi:putative tRNA adenosine deaminase-associated protein
VTLDGDLTAVVPDQTRGPDTRGDRLGDVDFALAAYREEGEWQVVELPPERAEDLPTLATELRRWPGDFGCLGLVSVDEDFFLVVRVAGPHVRVLISDVTAATDWPLARSALEQLDLPLPDDEDDPEPGGDPGIVADLGLPAMDMGALLDDLERFPDEALGEIAHRLGFGPLYDEVLGVPSAVAP